MSTIQEPQLGCKGQSVSDEYRRWVFSHMPAMGRLLDILDAGTTPNFLDIMAAISDEVAFYTECDTNPVDPPENIFLMSGKCCRFCC